MTWTTPLQASATGGPIAVVVLAMAALLLAAALAVGIAVRVLRGYRHTGDRAHLFLAVGLLLLIAVPTLLRFVLATFVPVPALARALVTTLSELAGLAAILYTIYGNP